MKYRVRTCLAASGIALLASACGTTSGSVTTRNLSQASDERPYLLPLWFENEAALMKWVEASCCGHRKRRFEYGEYQILVVLRQHTSCLDSNEPVVFVEDSGRWIAVLAGKAYWFGMDASVDGESLIFWRIDWNKNEKRETRKEIFRFALPDLLE